MTARRSARSIPPAPEIPGDSKDELLSIELLHVGIVSVGESKQEANSDTIARSKVEFYVEEMKLEFGGTQG